MVNVRIRKFLVVVDNTTECHSAINYASQRAVRTGRKLTLLRVIDPSDFHHWLGVGKLMKQEAETEASIVLERLSSLVNQETGLIPEIIIRHGQPSSEIINLIKEDKAISLLVLAAGTELNNPGPLVSNFTGTKSGIFPIPITIVPGHLSEKTIIELT
ncbi:universal stress protein [Hyphomicrobiales bacterium]|jgi:nucleotide-binding universal stress UspA family protein|nr:universal stress protein [Hyphomicrobiales bacterium]|tara:strand:- start:573 stop:1046 length:474 start_codon:yes stop_codon:yes gene_type:complete